MFAIRKYSFGTLNVSRCPWLSYALMLAIFFSIGHFAGAVQKEQDLLKAKGVVSEKYELRRADGKLMASLGTDADGQAALTFFDQNGKTRLELGIAENGAPTIALMGADGLPRLSLMMSPGVNEPEVILRDDSGRPAITLGVTRAHGPTLTIGRAGRSSIAVNVSREGAASIVLRDSGGGARITLSNADEGPEVVFAADRDHARARLKLDRAGSPTFLLYDRNDKERLSAQVDRDGRPSIRLIDPVKNTLKVLAAGVE